MQTFYERKNFSSDNNSFIIIIIVNICNKIHEKICHKVIVSTEDVVKQTNNNIRDVIHQKNYLILEMLKYDLSSIQTSFKMISPR